MKETIKCQYLYARIFYDESFALLALYFSNGEHTTLCSMMYVALLNAPLVTKAMTLFSVAKAFSRQTLAG